MARTTINVVNVLADYTTRQDNVGRKFDIHACADGRCLVDAVRLLHLQLFSSLRRRKSKAHHDKKLMSTTMSGARL